MIKKADGNNGELKAGRVVVNLTREELEFIDNIGRDALFTTGKRLTNNKIIRAFISVMQEIKVRGDGLYSAEELKNKILVKIKLKKNKRVYPRFKKEVTLSWRKASSSEKYNEGSTTEIGEGGFRVELKQNRAVGENLEFTINNPYEPYKPITVLGRIAWVKRRDEDSALEAGIKIICLSDKDRPGFSSLLYGESCPGFYHTKKGEDSQ